MIGVSGLTKNFRTLELVHASEAQQPSLPSMERWLPDSSQFETDDQLLERLGDLGAIVDPTPSQVQASARTVIARRSAKLVVCGNSVRGQTEPVVDAWGPHLMLDKVPHPDRAAARRRLARQAGGNLSDRRPVAMTRPSPSYARGIHASMTTSPVCRAGNKTSASSFTSHRGLTGRSVAATLPLVTAP